MNQQDMILEKIKQEYPGNIITQSCLRLEQSTTPRPTSTSYKFDILQTDQTNGLPSVVEHRLAVTDVFVATAVACYIYKAGSSTSATDTERSQAIPSTWPNPIIFTGANEAININGMYNGGLRILVNRKVYYEWFDTLRFYRVPDSQQGVLGGTGGVIVQKNAWYEAHYAFAPLQRTVTFGGQSQNELYWNQPIANTLIGTSSTNILCVYFRGYQIQGAATQLQQKLQAEEQASGR